MNELHLFAGAGGGILGGLLLGHVPVCAVELEKYPRAVLLQRQRDGILPWFPVWDDVCTFDGNPWRGRVDVVCGGFPCQDISAAGKGAGIDGQRSGLWSEFARILGEVRPRFVFMENSPMLTSRGLGRVLADLAGLGYRFAWGVLGSHNAGAPHYRDRIWIMAHAEGQRLPIPTEQKTQLSGFPRSECDRLHARGPASHRAVEPGVRRMVVGVADRVGQLKAIGNGQDPEVAALAWRTLMRRLIEN